MKYIELEIIESYILTERLTRLIIQKNLIQLQHFETTLLHLFNFVNVFKGENFKSGVGILESQLTD